MSQLIEEKLFSVSRRRLDVESSDDALGLLSNLGHSRSKSLERLSIEEQHNGSSPTLNLQQHMFLTSPEQVSQVHDSYPEKYASSIREIEKRAEGKSKRALQSPIGSSYLPNRGNDTGSRKKIETLDFWKLRIGLLETCHSLGSPFDFHLQSLIIRLDPDKCLAFSCRLFASFSRPLTPSLFPLRRPHHLPCGVGSPLGRSDSDTEGRPQTGLSSSVLPL